MVATRHFGAASAFSITTLTNSATPLDAYSHAIRINLYISKVWFNLTSLYKSCNNQISDAIDAYAHAAELDPGNPHITQRLNLL
ncbi:hypothetical protein FS749_001993 [Ceratobasidium sp. UAMH 11750]|nr:hypothetical protein FS749_001993 [Ceratobasidium sp. UAMH 11750]